MLIKKNVYPKTNFIHEYIKETNKSELNQSMVFSCPIKLSNPQQVLTNTKNNQPKLHNRLVIHQWQPAILLLHIYMI